MRRLLSLVVAAALGFAALEALPEAGGNRPPTATAGRQAEARETGRVLVKFRPGVANARKDEVERGAGASRAGEHARLGIRVLRSPNPRAAVAALRRSADVLWAEPEVRVERFADAVTPERTELAYDAALAKDPRMRGRGVMVAVIDDGVYPDNPDLEGRVDDGGDHSGPTPLPTGGTVPAGSHGTAVATILAAAADGRGIVGAVPEARVLALRVFGVDGASTLGVASAIVAAADRGAEVANLSLGSPYDSQALRDAIAEARRVAPGMVLVAAAGNDGAERPNYPAGSQYVVSVGATERRDDGSWAVTDFSTKGDVDVVAPGRGVLAWYSETGPPRSVVPVDGTSFASPEVAGIVAQLAGIGVTGDRARAAVVASAEAPAPSGYPAVASGRGRADALRAYTAATGTGSYTAVFVDGGAQVANVVGRRRFEAVRVGPAPAVVTAQRGTVAGVTTSGGSGVHRTVGTYAAPAVDAGVVDTALTTPEASAPLRLLPPTNGPEGRQAVPGARETPTLRYGSTSRYVVSVGLRAGSELSVDFAYPPDSPTALLHVWEGSAAEPPVASDRSGSYGGTLRFTAPRTGRYVVGFVLTKPEDDGPYALTARFPAPAAAALTPLPVSTSSLSATTAFPVRWAGPAGAVGFDVEYAVGSTGTWRPWLSATTVKAATFRGASGQTYRFRVRARDDLGNGGPWSGVGTTAVPLDERHGLLAYSTGWAAATPSGRFASTLRTATAGGRAVSLRVSTSRLVVVGERCASCGQVRVYLDGVLRATVDTRAATAAARVVLWDSGALAGGVRAHTLRLVTVGTARRPFVGLDAVAFLR